MAKADIEILMIEDDLADGRAGKSNIPSEPSGQQDSDYSKWRGSSGLSLLQRDPQRAKPRAHAGVAAAGFEAARDERH